MNRCTGPCGRELTPSISSPDGYGGTRKVCRDCFNKGRRKTERRSPSPRIPAPRQRGASKWPTVEAFDATEADPKTTDYCVVCGESPDSGSHLPHGHEYVAPVRQFDGAAAVQPNDPSLPSPQVSVVEEPITRVEEHRLKKKVRDLERENEELVRQLSEGGEYHEVVAEVLARQGECPGPRVGPRERTSNLSEATPLILASDWHIEEEVRPEQVQGRNRYDLDISKRRMERFFEATRWAIGHQRQVPFKIRDAILWLGGDFITNFLRDENRQANLLSPTDAILYAQQSLVAGIDFLLEDPEIEQWILPTNDGNHGRTTKKMESATRTQNSLEVFLYAQLAMHYKDEPRVRIILPTSSFTYLDEVYGRTIRFLHGDVFKYHGGVGGITVPLFRSLARWETVKHADLSCMGHWHQRICLPNLMVNGSLIGFNSFAQDIGAGFEAPVQSLRMLEPRRWCSSDVPLWVSERADDQMNQEEP